MLSEKDIEMMCSKVLNLDIQSFSFSKYIEKFKVKCVKTSDGQPIIMVDIVNYPWSLSFFDEFESFGEEFLDKTRLEVEDKLEVFDFKIPNCEIDVNMVRQFENGTSV